MPTTTAIVPALASVWAGKYRGCLSQREGNHGVQTAVRSSNGRGDDDDRIWRGNREKEEKKGGITRRDRGELERKGGRY
jgi:hypothetical protein